MRLIVKAMFLVILGINLVATPVAAGGTAEADDTAIKAATGTEGSDAPRAPDHAAGPVEAHDCSEWRLMVNAETGEPVSVQIRSDGLLEFLWSRMCEGDLQQTKWVLGPSPRDVAQDLYDEQSAKLPKPVLSLSGLIDHQIVNEETTISVTPIAPVSATAQVPGLSVTVTATPRLIRFDTGSIVPGDTTHFECPPWGGDGCTWTPRYPSVLKTTGYDDHRYHATASIVWSVAWTSSVGPGGTLADVTSTAPVLVGVGEIQVIGGG